MIERGILRFGMASSAVDSKQSDGTLDLLVLWGGESAWGITNPDKGVRLGEEVCLVKLIGSYIGASAHVTPCGAAFTKEMLVNKVDWGLLMLGMAGTGHIVKDALGPLGVF